MPSCERCGSVRPTCEVAKKPSGYRCKDVTRCVERQRRAQLSLERSR